MATPPILDNKKHDQPSDFVPSVMIREARRQKGLPIVDVPPVCILDPDGDLVRRLWATGQAERFEAWPCYHTDLYTFALDGRALAEKQVLSPIWCDLRCDNAQSLGSDYNTCFLQHLARTCFLPCLAEHVLPSGKREFALVLASQRP